MSTYMFQNHPHAKAQQMAKKIARWFNDHKTHRSHGKPLRYEDVHGQGVRVTLLEENDDLQDKVLSAWYSVQLTLSQTAVSKLIENSDGNAWMLAGSPGVQLIFGGQSPVPPRLSSAQRSDSRVSLGLGGDYEDAWAEWSSEDDRTLSGND